MRKLLVLIMFLSTSAFADFSAKVINIIDGDTIDVLTYNNKRIRIRLVDIDAPERGQPFVNESKQFLSSLITKKVVLIKEQGQDIYNRMLGTIYYKKQNINELMVLNGYAWAYRYRNKASNKTMIMLETKAKQNHLGLWQEDNPVAPWEFKRRAIK
ncbi:thermonuclease family protein [Orbus wheelerorum]|uniref:thermonuclease family protein n=1 Tax=Orbus wheelerorum TaxID=3074111 RepID=UPI00370D7069